MFAGGLDLRGVPSMIPLVFFVLASFWMIKDTFLEPVSENSKTRTVWQSEDGDIRPILGSKKLTLFGMVVIDVLLFLPIVMPIYGGLAFLRAYVNVLVRGNHFKFVSASKGKAPFHLQVEKEEVITNV